ncbi:preprotein translocase subunit SecG [Algimonas porphyrae]|uniref:Protein-export membrane protein SecG n=1 Tax=Algimonas porphyrae TaxID=1128113 RepID=A0ABQ5UYC9_9PROT|nr:preprotein translocase subunit SecG [Algimonas porphyrae]GLQ20313.1 hypothetical protein GCM10007854_12680 [Algimonas porphyrae]
MSTVLLVILLIISVIMTGLILIQRSEGGALGIGGGGGGGGSGFMSGRAATTSVARMTAILGTIFLILSLLLSVVFALETNNTSRLDGNDVDGAVAIDTETGEPAADESATDE